MLNTIFATKRGMSQVWTDQGKRMPVTKCDIQSNIVVGQQKCVAVNRDTNDLQRQPCIIFEIGYGKKKLKNMTKPLRTKIKKSGFSFGIKQIKGVKKFLKNNDESTQDLKVGDILKPTEILAVGDIVKVQGVSKGHGFTGVVKRYGMAGGPRTHGQRDRERAVGSIGAMTYPGRVWKGKKMPGHHGNEVKTITNLTVLYVSSDSLWLSGPIPGFRGSTIRIIKTGDKKEIKLDEVASGLKNKVQKEVEEQEDQSKKHKKN